MDPKLAEIYGTNQATDADLEKLAAAELADGLANDDQLDTDGLSEEELEAVAQDVLNAGAEEGGEEVEEQEKTSAAEAQEKLAEADYLGRVMAHSYVNELRSIEKTAAKMGPATRDEHFTSMGKEQMGAGQKAHSMARQAGLAVKGGAKRYANLMAGGAKGEIGSMGGKRAGNALMTSLKGGSGMRGEALKSLGARAGTAAGVAGLGLAAHKMLKKKESSAMDTLVEARAMEILQASGIDPAELEQVEGQEKVSDPREALAAAVDERAWAVLGQYGVVPNEE